jgi:hypothetical protein
VCVCVCVCVCVLLWESARGFVYAIGHVYAGKIGVG